MPLEHSVVTDNSLLPFATPGSVFVPRGTGYGSSTTVSISSIFENGLTLAWESHASVHDRVTVGTYGDLKFRSSASWYDAYVTPIFFSQDTSVPTPGVANSGIWIDFNTDRDSLVFTWNAVGQAPGNTDHPSTYQVEIRDLGDGDSEIIYRFYDTSYPAPGDTGFLSATYGVPTDFWRMGTFDRWDETPGNTGVVGVWQLRVEDGFVRPADIVAVPVHRDGTDGDDHLLGWLRGDWLTGRGGNDTLEGFAGDDTLAAADGNNLILGGDGQDL